MENNKAIWPYFTFFYSGGGPGNCDISNSDGFDAYNYEVWGMFTQPADKDLFFEPAPPPPP